MGCWNETCFISNLPIRHGEPVVAFFTAVGGWELHRKKGKRKAHGRDRASHVYPADGEEPITLPIRAQYNDYGSIENWDNNDIAVRMAESLFEKSLEDALESVMNHMSKQYGLYISKRDKLKYPVSFLMAKESVFNKLFERYQPKYDEWNNKYKEREMDFHEQFSRQEQLEELGKKRKAGALTEADQAILDSGDLLRTSLEIIMLGSAREELKFSGVNFREELHKAWRAASPNKRERLARDFHKLDKELKVVGSAMHTLRRSWTPGSGAGSQSFSLKDHLAFCDIVKQSALDSFDSTEELYSYMLSDYDY